MRSAPLALALLIAAASARAEEPAAAPAPPPTHLPAVPVAPASSPPAAPVVPDRGAEPSSGIWLILAGTGLTVGGMANFATSPICLSSKIAASGHGGCLGMSLAFGVGLVGGGIPLLVLGVRQRRAWQDWTAGQRVGFAPVAGGAALTWGRSW